MADEIRPGTGSEPEMTAEFHRRRERSRRSLLRANTVVLCALLAVLGLAALATLASWSARRNQRRAEEAQAAARVELLRAYLSDIRAIRKDKTLGRRSAALEVIRRAAAITPSTELRNEAVATLALADVRSETQMTIEPGAVATAFDPALRFCASSLTNGEVLIRSLRDGSEAVRLRLADGRIPLEQGYPHGLEFSPDGRRLSVRYWYGGVAVWDWEKRETVFRHDISERHRATSRLRFSGDGAFVVGPVFEPKVGMAVFEIATGRRVAFFPEFTTYRHVAVRPGRPMFAVNTASNVIVLNWETGATVAEFPFEAGVRAMSWSADGRLLALGGNLLEVQVWDVDARRRQVLTGHKHDVWSVAFDAAGERLATSSFDGTCRLWDLRDGRLLGVTGEGAVLQWGADDRLGIEKPGRVPELRRLIASPVHRELAGPADVSSGRVMDISADGRWAISGAGRDTLQVWPLETPGGMTTRPAEWLRSVSFHPTDSRMFITKRSGPDTIPFRSETNATGVRLALEPAVPMRAIGDRRFDLVVSSLDGRKRAWVELSAGRAWIEIVGSTNKPVMLGSFLHNSTVDGSASVRGGSSISLSVDGRWLACGVSEGSSRVFDAESGNLARTLVPRESGVHFSPDGRWLASADRTKCRIFRVADWSQVWEREHALVESFAVAFSPDGEWVAAASSPDSATLFEAATGRELVRLQSPDPAPIVNMRWSADGRRLVFATRENHVEVWQPAALRRELAELGLGWDAPSPAPVAVALPGSDSGTPWFAFGIFATVGFVAALAGLSLQRHRRLIESYARTEALAMERERELHGEREVSRLKNSFVSMVSHEFRTPLGIIQSSAQILDRYLEKLPPEQRREQLQSITGNVRRMAGLIDEVLLLGKAEAGQMRFTPAPLDLPGFCRRLVDEMHSATKRQCPILLTVKEDAFAGPPAPESDEALLRHILGNLLSNAVKYSPPGKPVHFAITRSEDRAVFTIRDEGMGIPASDRAKLFTAFHRGANVGTRRGTGLGLTIVKRCVELHGGEISFESEEERGTTFTVRLPVFPSRAPTSHPPTTL